MALGSQKPKSQGLNLPGMQLDDDQSFLNFAGESEDILGEDEPEEAK